MRSHVCPWWGGYFIDNRIRRWIHNPRRILAPYLRPGMTVMDFGCGMGMFSIAMAQLVGGEGRVIAVDLQQEMLDVLRKRAGKAGVGDRIRVHRCQPTSIGLDEPVEGFSQSGDSLRAASGCAPDRAGLGRGGRPASEKVPPIDFALAFYSAHEAPDPRRLLGEIHGLLGPQGKLLVVEPIGHVTAKNFQELLSLAQEVGLREQQRPHVRLSRAVLLAKG